MNKIEIEIKSRNKFNILLTAILSVVFLFYLILVFDRIILAEKSEAYFAAFVFFMFFLVSIIISLHVILNKRERKILISKDVITINNKDYNRKNLKEITLRKIHLLRGSITNSIILVFQNESKVIAYDIDDIYAIELIDKLSEILELEPKIKKGLYI